MFDLEGPLTYNCSESRREVLTGILTDEAPGPVAGSVGIEGGVVSGVINLESLGVRAPSRRPRHENRYHDA